MMRLGFLAGRSDFSNATPFKERKKQRENILSFHSFHSYLRDIIYIYNIYTFLPSLLYYNVALCLPFHCPLFVPQFAL